MFDGGVFFTLLGIAFIIILFKIPYREFLFWVSSGIFLILGFVLYSNHSVVFKISTTDGVNMINQTSYIIGDPSVAYNESAMPLSFFLVILGFVIAFIGLAMWANPHKQQF